ncbi:MAG: bifunctional folylpolyglutamate synthase/dihydrofolate synthase [Acidobacteria bacterium]|nr:MAG: bifunctional folylpolyglutamate synthase/dihydrofolate synthase [Acidobacteriota bacterium]
MNFDESVSYLLGLGHETVAIKLGLDNITRLLARLGDPHTTFPSVQIAGTNGKGSTAAMLESVCRAAGLSAGLYTSPHLVSIRERVRVAGREIARDEFARCASLVRAAAEETERESGALPTFFEQMTALALVAFREARVPVAILETGLGGRLDATTAARAATVAITPVSLDHQEYLGHTLAEIAAEKAAIIRPGVKAVVAPQEPEAAEVILRRCRECGVEPRFATRDAEVESTCGDGRLRVRLRTARDVYAGVCLALRGRHQLTNAAVAVALAESLAEDSFHITREHVVAGLEAAEHAGRLELDARRTPALLLDGAHNPAGARALRAYLDEFAGGKVTLVFGAMRDKALAEIGAILFPAAEHLVLTEPRNPRAASVAELLRAVPARSASSTIALAPSSRDALTIARAHTPPGGTVCVTGSLYLVGEVKGLLETGGENF